MKEISAKKLQVVGISYDSQKVLAKFAKQGSIKFPLLSDVGSKTIKAFGIHNRGGLPHPATFVVNQDGTIKAKLPGTTRTRHTTEQLLKAVK